MIDITPLTKSPTGVFLLSAGFAVLVFSIRALWAFILKEKTGDFKAIERRVAMLDETQQQHEKEIALLKQQADQTREFLAKLEELPVLVRVLNVETKHLVSELADVKKRLGR